MRSAVVVRVHKRRDKENGSLQRDDSKDSKKDQDGIYPAGLSHEPCLEHRVFCVDPHRLLALAELLQRHRGDDAHVGDVPGQQSSLGVRYAVPRCVREAIGGLERRVTGVSSVFWLTFLWVKSASVYLC